MATPEVEAIDDAMEVLIEALREQRRVAVCTRIERKRPPHEHAVVFVMRGMTYVDAESVRAFLNDYADEALKTAQKERVQHDEAGNPITPLHFAQAAFMKELALSGQGGRMMLMESLSKAGVVQPDRLGVCFGLWTSTIKAHGIADAVAETVARFGLNQTDLKGGTMIPAGEGSPPDAG